MLCLTCTNSEGRSIKGECLSCYNKTWRKANPTKAFASRKKASLKRIYGMTLEDLQRLAETQELKCALCGTQSKLGTNHGLHVDHDHKTGKVRALICAPCNRGLGQFKDSPELLEKAAIYLRSKS